MNITTREIDAFFKENELVFARGTPAAAAINQYARDTRDIEMRIIGDKASICSLGSVDSLGGGKVDFSKLERIKDTQFYNFDVARAVGCSVDAVIFGLAAQDGNIASRAHMKDIIHGMHKFGSKSAYGTALTGDIDGVPGMYVIKVPNNPSNITASDDLTHEGFVGLFGLNKIRSVNYAKVFGVIRGGAPDVDTKGNVISLLSKNVSAKVPYVIYENVFPSVSFRSYLSTATAAQFHSCLAQMLYATQTAFEKIGFTHYDAHYENWLVRDAPAISAPFAIRYKDRRRGKEVFITSENVMTCIDYGMATFRYEGRQMSVMKPFMVPYGVKVNPNPMYDAYKLIMFSAMEAQKKGNAVVYREAEKIFPFFNQRETLTVALRLQEKYLYGLPDLAPGVSLYDLIDHIRDVCDVEKVITSHPVAPVLECASCYSFLGALKNSLTGQYQAESFFEFYDIATRLRNSKKYDAFVSSYDYARGKDLFIERVDRDVGRLSYLVSKMSRQKSVVLDETYTARRLANRELVATLSAQFNDLLLAISLFEDISEWLKVGTSVGALKGDRDLMDYLHNQREYLLNEALPALFSLVQAARANYKRVRTIAYTGEWQQYEEDYPWYMMTFSQVVHLTHRLEEGRKDAFESTRLPEIEKIPEHVRRPPTERRGLLPAQKIVPIRDSTGNIGNIKLP